MATLAEIVRTSVAEGTGALAPAPYFFTITSAGYKHYTANLAESLRRLRHPRPAIFCADKESQQFCARAGLGGVLVPPEPYKRSVVVGHREPLVFGTPSFKDLVRHKMRLLSEVVATVPDGRGFLFLDSDVVGLRHIQDALAAATAGQVPKVWFQCDEKLPYGHACSAAACPNICTGVIYVPAMEEGLRQRLRELFRIDETAWGGALTDQDYIQGRLRTCGFVAGEHYSVLPRQLVPNGATLDPETQLYPWGVVAADREKIPALLHFNYVVSSNKRRVMEKNGAWLLQG